MVAIDPPCPPETSPLTAVLLAAALALPGIAASPALAEGPPTAPRVSVRSLDYQDFEGNQRRIRILAPAFHTVAPLDESTSLEAIIIRDSVSGASPGPIFPGAAPGPTGARVPVSDRRHALDLKATRFFERVSLGVSAGLSREADWVSRSLGLESRISTDDNNTTLALGAGLTGDSITSSANPFLKESRRSRNLLLGVTQVLSPVDLVQINLTLGLGNGFFADVYRPGDVRPDHRRQGAALVRWNHFVESAGAALHLDYRATADDWGVRSHMLEAAWYQPLGETWRVQPRLRYYSQSAARFYSNGPDLRTDFTAPFSTDYRLAAFGAFSGGLKVSKALSDTLSLDGAIDWYGQRPGWHLGGNGTATLAPLNARILSVGLTWDW